MARLPEPGGDAGNWGEVLNEFLQVEHSADGSLNPGGSLAAKYEKPASGIPEVDLNGAVQASLDRADISLNQSDTQTLIGSEIASPGTAAKLAVEGVAEEYTGRTQIGLYDDFSRYADLIEPGRGNPAHWANLASDWSGHSGNYQWNVYHPWQWLSLCHLCRQTLIVMGDGAL